MNSSSFLTLEQFDKYLDRESDIRDPERHSLNVNRRLMERNGFFNMDSKTGRTHSLGEITGESFQDMDADHGMPSRFFLENEQTPSRHTSPDYNPNLDFELFEKKPDLNISYTDSSSKIHFSDISEQQQILSKKSFINQNDKELSKNLEYFTIAFLNRISSSFNRLRSIVLSPYSIISVFGVLYRGSNSSTEIELREFFKYPNKNTIFTSLLNIQKDMIKNGTALISNNIYFSNKFPLNQIFINYVKELVDIISINPLNRIGTVEKINVDISKKSKGVFNSVIDPSMIKPDTSLMIINTIYFYSSWKTKFNKDQTRPEPFYGMNHTYRTVPLMTQYNVNHYYFEDTENQVLEMDYKDNNYCFGIVLPKSRSYPELRPDQLEYYISLLSKTDIHTVSIPKFKQMSKYNINNLLKQLGLQNIFKQADLSEITPGSMKLNLSDIIHHTFIIIDERGGESINNKHLQNSLPDHIKRTVIANHPFLYYVRHKPSNILLITGVYC